MNDVPEFQEDFDAQFWIDSPEASLAECAQRTLAPAQLVGLLSLLWPELIVFKGRAFIASRFSEAAFQRWEEAVEGPDTEREVQRMMNHVHVPDYFHELGPQLSERNVAFVATVLAGAWKSRIERVSRMQRVVAEVVGDEVYVYED